MAEFDVTLSAMRDAASNIKNYTEEFKDQAEQTYQAAQKLSEGWVGDASQTFVENMEQLRQWMRCSEDTVLYECSQFDPEGLRLARQWADRYCK